MSDLLNWLKELYMVVKHKEIVWKPVHPNNILGNPICGIYADFNTPKLGKYYYIKFTIEYQSRMDENLIHYRDEGTKYYILHSLVKYDLDEPFIVPSPSNNISNDEYSISVNDYGRFYYVFDDEETAKLSVYKKLINMIYPYLYILSDEELDEWESFVKQMDEI